MYNLCMPRIPYPSKFGPIWKNVEQNSICQVVFGSKIFYCRFHILESIVIHSKYGRTYQKIHIGRGPICSVHGQGGHMWPWVPLTRLSYTSAPMRYIIYRISRTSIADKRDILVGRMVVRCGEESGTHLVLYMASILCDVQYKQRVWRTARAVRQTLLDNVVVGI